MKTDLSGSLRLLLDSAVGRARRLEYSQQPLAAAEACDEAARFTEQIASSANTPAEQQRRLASAHGFRQLALKLREKARCPQPGSEAPVTEGDSLD